MTSLLGTAAAEIVYPNALTRRQRRSQFDRGPKASTEHCHSQCSEAAHGERSRPVAGRSILLLSRSHQSIFCFPNNATPFQWPSFRTEPKTTKYEISNLIFHNIFILRCNCLQQVGAKVRQLNWHW